MENTIVVRGLSFRTWVLPTCVRIASADTQEILEISLESLALNYGGKPSRFFGKTIGEWLTLV